MCFFFCLLDLDARPWDFQAEECILRACVDRFNNRRYLSARTRTATGNGTSNVQNSGNMGYEGNEYDQNLIEVQLHNTFNGDKFIYAPGYGGWDDGVELTDEFKQQYEIWLQHEVFNSPTNWDSFVADTQNYLGV